MERSGRSIADDDDTMNPRRAARRAKNGQQPGGPAKAAEALLALIDAETPPVRLYLGEDALGLVEKKLDAMKAEIAAWRGLSRSTSFPA